MMKMSAMQSLMDRNMLYLDVVSGTAGSFLASQLKQSGHKFKAFDVVAVLIARSIADFFLPEVFSDLPALALLTTVGHFL